MAIRKQKGLGLGLEALLGPAVDATSGDAAANDAPRSLPLDQLQPGRYQPRTRIDDAALAELADSIRAQGVMQPVLVRPVAHEDGRRYEIIAGERRFRAARLAGLDRVPVLVRDVDDQAAAAMALIENIQRQDLSPLEEARGLKRLVDEFGMTHEAAAGAVGRSRSAASNLLRLLNLPEPVQRLLESGALEMGHARALLPLDGARQITAANEIIARGLNVREAEKLAARNARGGDGLGDGSGPGRRRDASGRAGTAGAAGTGARDIARIEARLADALAAPVAIRVKPGAAKSANGARGLRGEIAIGFASLDEMNGVLARLGLESQ